MTEVSFRVLDSPANAKRNETSGSREDDFKRYPEKIRVFMTKVEPMTFRCTTTKLYETRGSFGLKNSSLQATIVLLYFPMRKNVER